MVEKAKCRYYQAKMKGGRPRGIASIYQSLEEVSGLCIYLYKTLLGFSFLFT